MVPVLCLWHTLLIIVAWVLPRAFLHAGISHSVASVSCVLTQG